MSILIGADLVPTKSNVQQFVSGNALRLVDKKLMSLLCDADYRIYNLETPLTDVSDPIKKRGPSLMAPTASVAGYKALKADLLTLANNHILDQGEKGLRETLEVLEANGIAFVGVGNDLAEAEKAFILHSDGKTIGIYACAEHEFSIATEVSVGANPFDPLYSLDHVFELKKDCDFVIVLYHGGKEHYRYPSPRLQKICRRLVEKGADLVICQHSHCVGCEEKYRDGTIVYGQGNLLFDDEDNEFWNSSLLVKLSSDLQISYIPLQKLGSTVCMAEGECAENIMSGFLARSKEIQVPGYIERLYKQFGSNYLEHYLSVIQGKEDFCFRILNKLLQNRLRKWKLSYKYDEKHLIGILNFIECEAHRELILEGFRSHIY